ncbi:uncharacterized protein LOC120682051 isoform X2 [Panicum virgatum]|uniref:uncharacterized protein LOC120682051 isoform X2 n=1 Tax=Panicum virgatum TaxID=38727 RepID=UPI0019D6174A|nr:uncharacterized protein LOC120682051 isoform X2 [Panicum virgatum]
MLICSVLNPSSLKRCRCHTLPTLYQGVHFLLKLTRIHSVFILFERQYVVSCPVWHLFAVKLSGDPAAWAAWPVAAVVKVKTLDEGASTITRMATSSFNPPQQGCTASAHCSRASFLPSWILGDSSAPVGLGCLILCQVFLLFRVCPVMVTATRALSDQGLPCNYYRSVKELTGEPSGSLFPLEENCLLSELSCASFLGC